MSFIANLPFILFYLIQNWIQNQVSLGQISLILVSIMVERTLIQLLLLTCQQKRVLWQMFLQDIHVDVQQTSKTTAFLWKFCDFFWGGGEQVTLCPVVFLYLFKSVRSMTSPWMHFGNAETTAHPACVCQCYEINITTNSQ